MQEKDKENKFGDIFKKVVTTGLSAAFMTEDAIKNALGDLSVPKELLNSVLQHAKSAKGDFIQSVKNEMKEYLNRIDLSKEVDRILNKYDLEVSAQIKFRPKNKNDDEIKVETDQETSDQQTTASVDLPSKKIKKTK
jgi:hypothetical protein